MNKSNKGFSLTVTAPPASANNGHDGYFVRPDGTVRYSSVATREPCGDAGTPVSQQPFNVKPVCPWVVV